MSDSVREFPISGVCCANGIVRLKKTLAPLDGVAEVKVDLARGVARVKGPCDPAAVRLALDEAGFPASASL